jgi:hypothetical protein
MQSTACSFWRVCDEVVRSKTLYERNAARGVNSACKESQGREILFIFRLCIKESEKHIYRKKFLVSTL